MLVGLLFTGEASVLGHQLIVDVTSSAILFTGQQLHGASVCNAFTVEFRLLAVLFFAKSL